MKEKFVLSFVILLLLAPCLSLAWTEPSNVPPAGNVPAPINVGSAAQTKQGALTILAETDNSTKGLMVGSNALNLQAAQNLIYGNIDSASAGNLLLLQKEDATEVVINNNGRIGVGKANPAYAIDVSGGGADGQVNVSNGLCINGDCRTTWSSVGGHWTQTGFSLYPNNTAWDVGIGTANPAASLHVSGPNIIFGQGEAGVPAPVTLRGPAAAGDNISGADFTIDASNGTGAGGSGDIIFRTAGLSTSSGIEIDAVSSADSGGANVETLQWSHTISSGNNRILIVQVALNGGLAGFISSVTYGGSNLTKLDEQNLVDSASIWYLKNPPLGTADIIIDLLGFMSAEITGGAVSYKNVNQAASFGAVVKTASFFGPTNSASINVNSAANELVIDLIVVDDDVSGFTVGAGQTKRWSRQTTSAFGGLTAANSDEPGAASVTMSWSWIGNEVWVILAVPLRPSPPVPNSNPNDLTERLRITNSGNIGIGTANPGALLDINGQIKINGGSPGAGKVLTSDAAGLATWGTLSSGLPAGTSGQTLRYDGANWVANDIIYNNGVNVGIGTTGPTEKLHVEGDTLIDIYSGVGTQGGLFFREGFTNANKYNLAILTEDFGGGGSMDALSISAFDGIRFVTGTNDATGERVRITNSGNVGIGTANPQQKLEINGALRFSETDSDNAYFSEVTPDGDNKINIRLTLADDNSDDEKFEIFTDYWNGSASDRAVHYFTAAGNAYHYGKLGIGTTAPNESLEINGGLRLNTTAAKPICNAAKRGALWFTQGAAGVKDALEVCAKDAADIYNWRTIY